MTEENLKWLENVFRRTVGENGEIRLQDFKNIVHSKNPFFVERVFHIFDKDDNGSISLQEFIDAMHQFAGQSPDDKIKFLFKVYDIDGKFTLKKISARTLHLTTFVSQKKWSIACSKVVTLRIPFSPPLLTISSIGKSLKCYFVLKQ